jgi:hypothetical protein
MLNTLIAFIFIFIIHLLDFIYKIFILSNLSVSSTETIFKDLTIYY